MRKLCNICGENCALNRGEGCLCGHGETCPVCQDCTRRLLKKKCGFSLRAKPSIDEILARRIKKLNSERKARLAELCLLLRSGRVIVSPPNGYNVVLMNDKGIFSMKKQFLGELR